MSRLTTLPAAALLALAVSAHAASAQSCRVKPTEAGNFGPTYVLDPFTVTNTSCARGRAVIRAFHSCRKTHGGLKKGRCPKSAAILGYHCTEKRSENAIQISGKVTCVFGQRKVVHYYSQNTH